MALGHLRDPFEIFFGQHAARRIVRRVDHDGFGAVRDAALELVQIHAPVFFFQQRNRNRLGAEIVGTRCVRRIGGIEVDEFVAATEQRTEDVPDDRFGAGREHDVFRGPGLDMAEL